MDIIAGLCFVALALYLGFDRMSDVLEGFKDQYERHVDAMIDAARPLAGCTSRDVDEPDFDDPEYPDPLPEMLGSPRFEAIWRAIKEWDISRYREDRSYAGASGNDVMHILLELDKTDRGAIEALVKVKEELWAEYCLRRGVKPTDFDEAFKSSPVIRIIDEALGR